MSASKYIRHDYQHSFGHLVEESGELIAALGKTLRWGPDSYNPELPPEQRETNADWVRREIADLRGALDRFEAALNERSPS